MISREQRLPVAIALLALFVALGGTSYAAVKLKKDSVTTREIKDGTIAQADLAAGVAIAGPAGARGPRGAEGASGRDGRDGKDGIPSRAYVSRNPSILTVPPQATTIASLRLPAGHYAIHWSSNVFSLDPTTWIDCAIVTGDVVITRTSTTVGTDVNARPDGSRTDGTIEASMAASDVVSLGSAATVTASCAQRSTNFSPKLAFGRLVAVPVASVEVQ